MLDQETVMRAAKAYTEDILKEFSPSAVVLFGSYANNTAREDSDINIAVIFRSYDGNWLMDSARLWKLAYGRSIEIEPILLDEENDQSGFVENIFKTGVILYQSNVLKPKPETL